MSWKRGITLMDLDGNEELEVTCKRCGVMRYKKATTLLRDDELAHAYLDEVEKHLRCDTRTCKGPVRLAMTHDGKMQGFVGGMA